MGLETLLVLFGVIGQAASNEGTKVHEVAETCLTIGIVMLLVELFFWLMLVLFSDR